MTKFMTRLLALLLSCMLLGSQAMASELIAQDKIVADEVNYKTELVEKGSLIKTTTSQASEYYPVYVSVTYEGNQGLFVENLVRSGDTVKKGDPIARITPKYDQVALTQQQLNYSRALESYAEGKAYYTNLLADLQQQLSGAGDEYSRACVQIELEKAQIRKDQYCYQQERSLQQQLDNLNEQLEMLEQDVVCAPCDGEVVDISYKYPGESVYKGTYICQIYDPSVMMLAVNNAELRYGMSAVITTGANKDRTELSGRVVAAADCLPDSNITYALVEIHGYDVDADINWRNIKINAETINLQNVLKISKNTWTLSSGKYVVQKLSDDGALQRRFITPGLINGKEMWVLQGLDEGDRVIIE